MEYKMKLQKAPFDAILTGRKSIELRLNDEKRQKIQVGDSIVFQLCGTQQQIRSTVAALHHADSFAELFERLPLSDCGFSPEDGADSAVKSMRNYYSAQQEQTFGVLGIELSKLR